MATTCLPEVQDNLDRYVSTLTDSGLSDAAAAMHLAAVRRLGDRISPRQVTAATAADVASFLEFLEGQGLAGAGLQAHGHALNQWLDHLKGGGEPASGPAIETQPVSSDDDASTVLVDAVLDVPSWGAGTPTRAPSRGLTNSS